MTSAERLIELDEIERQKNQKTYQIIKRNDLVRRGRSGFGIKENRLIEYICSKVPSPIKTDDGIEVEELEVPTEYTFNIKEYAKDCNISLSGDFYQDTKEAIKRLRDESFEYKDENGKVRPVSWLSDYEIDEGTKTRKGTGEIKYELGKNILPFIGFQKSGNYAKCEFWEVLGLTKEKAIPLFDLLNSYEYLHTFVVTFNDLKWILKLDKNEYYSEYKRFNSKVLKPIIEQINKYTSLNVSYKSKGRPVSEILFYIKRKTSVEIFNINQ